MNSISRSDFDPESAKKRRISIETRDNTRFIAEYRLSSSYTNNSSSSDIAKALPATNAVDLTTARFRMLANAEDFARPFESKVDNNLPPERYSHIDLVMHFSEIAHGGLGDSVLQSLIHGRRMFRRLYFNSTYCMYFEKLTINAPLIMYRLNTNPKPGIWIDQIIQWYPIFPNESEQFSTSDIFKKASIAQEKISFMHHLKLEFRELLVGYYEITEVFHHQLMEKLIEMVENHVLYIVEHGLAPFQMVNEVCKKCGESFGNKNDLINHHDLSACRLAPVHRCQCGGILLTHGEWHRHCFNPHMECPSFTWHIWRHKRSSSGYSFMCDGCQHIFQGFLRFWHHCCFCPFFFAFVVANCPFCTTQTRLEFYQLEETQRLLHRAHSDRTGIAIIRDWVRIKDMKFNVKLAIPEEPSFQI